MSKRSLHLVTHKEELAIREIMIDRIEGQLGRMDNLPKLSTKDLKKIHTQLYKSKPYRKSLYTKTNSNLWSNLTGDSINKPGGAQRFVDWTNSEQGKIMLKEWKKKR